MDDAAHPPRRYGEVRSSFSRCWWPSFLPSRSCSVESVLAAIILNLFLVVRRDPMTAKLPGPVIIMGILNNAIPFSLIAWARPAYRAGLHRILNATTPVFTVLTAHFLTQTERADLGARDRRIVRHPRVVVLVGPDAVRGLGSESLLGEAACLLAALSYAFAGIYGRRFKGMPSLHVATGQITGATMVMLPVAAITERFWALPAPRATVWGRVRRHRLTLHGARLHPLFPYPGNGRCHQPATGDILAADQRPLAWQPCPWRATYSQPPS